MSVQYEKGTWLLTWHTCVRFSYIQRGVLLYDYPEKYCRARPLKTKVSLCRKKQEKSASLFLRPFSHFLFSRDYWNLPTRPPIVVVVIIIAIRVVQITTPTRGHVISHTERRESIVDKKQLVAHRMCSKLATLSRALFAPPLHCVSRL